MSRTFRGKSRATAGRSIALWSTLLALSLTTRTVEASPLFELVGSGFGGGGLNGRVYGASAASTYFNPALLPQAKQGLEVGVFGLHDDIDVKLLPRGSAVDIPESAVNRFGTGHPGV